MLNLCVLIIAYSKLISLLGNSIACAKFSATYKLSDPIFVYLPTYKYVLTKQRIKTYLRMKLRP